MPPHKSHMVELGFAFTFYKVQGATLDRVILDFDFHTRIECSFPSVYVGLSRVRQIKDLRLLPRTAKADTWLASLKWADELAAWMNSLPR